MKERETYYVYYLYFIYLFVISISVLSNDEILLIVNVIKSMLTFGIIMFIILSVKNDTTFLFDKRVIVSLHCE